MADSPKSANNDETELTMCDVLEEEQELEEDANAVLGASDDTNCSYDEGYVPRQALYACKTCIGSSEPGGICLACCYACHDGHDVVELYTKRNFRCDCGNNKFPDKTCTLRPGKDDMNAKNKYNQNFKGLYCHCSRPYPDLDDDTPDEMIQCIMCEDWYHGRHIGAQVPEDYFEMICAKCMENHKFLYAYLNKFQYLKVDIEDGTGKRVPNGINTVESDIDNKDSSAKAETDDAVKQEVKESNDKETLSAENQLLQEKDQKSNNNFNNIQQTSSSVMEKDESNGIKAESNGIKAESNLVTEGEEICILQSLDIAADGIKKGPAFWPTNWRSELCHCTSCLEMYTKADCQYLLNPDDTIQAYEERGKCHSNESQYDKGLTALSRLDRVKQMEAIRAYTSMKGQLKEYLKQFADNKRTVSERDIKEFFDRISKRQKLNNGVPHFCR